MLAKGRIADCHAKACPQLLGGTIASAKRMEEPGEPCSLELCDARGWPG
jgi:hypothetical protein